MSTLGSLHLLAPEIPDGLSCWRLQVRVDDGTTPESVAEIAARDNGARPAYETLLLSDGELKRVRERAAKRPAAILPPPAPAISTATYETLRAEIGKMRALYDTLRAAHEATVSSLALGNTELAAVTAERDVTKASLVDARADLAMTRADLETAQADLVTTRADFDTAHSDLAAVRVDLSVTKADLDADRTALKAANAAADALQAALTQSEALRVAQTPAALTPWADLGRAIKRVLGI